MPTRKDLVRERVFIKKDIKMCQEIIDDAISNESNLADIDRLWESFNEESRVFNALQTGTPAQLYKEKDRFDKAIDSMKFLIDQHISRIAEIDLLLTNM